MRIAAVIVTYNRLAALRTSLPRLLAEPVDRVIVVDNAGTDGTGTWLDAQTDPRLEVLRLGENLGGAGGFEAGMARLVRAEDEAASPDWIVLLDDDSWPDPGAIARFRADFATAAADVGAIAAAVRLPDGAPAEMNRPGWNPFWHPHLIGATLRSALARRGRAGFKLTDAAFAPDAPVQEIDNASFVGFFVARSGWRATGLPEGGLFIYGDDVLYSLRLRRKRLRLLFAPQICFTHDCGTMGDGFVYRPLWKIYYHARNGVAIARAAAGPLVFPLALAWYVTVWIRRGRRARPEERPVYRRLMWAGVRDGLLGRRGRVDRVHRTSALAQNPPQV